MINIDHIYNTLLENGMVKNGVDFSTNWACRSRCWYGFTKHKKRAASLESIIQITISIRNKINSGEASIPDGVIALHDEMTAILKDRYQIAKLIVEL